MALSDYKPQRHEVVLKGGSFDVKGLSLEDLSTLIKTHLTELDTILDIADKAGVSNFEPEAMRPFALSLAKDAPGLVANIIALAAEDPSAAGAASLLPGPVQIETLMHIGRLTFEEVGGIKKAMEALVGLLGMLRPQRVAAQPKSSDKA